MQRLRELWKSAKDKLDAGELEAIQAIIATHGMKISATGYNFCRVQMRAQGLDGLPYLDCKTFKGWKDNGFQVRKGEHSTITGITWVGVGGKADDELLTDFEYMIPKEYHLFHRSQVSATGALETPNLFAMTG